MATPYYGAQPFPFAHPPAPAQPHDDCDPRDNPSPPAGVAPQPPQPPSPPATAATEATAGPAPPRSIFDVAQRAVAGQLPEGPGARALDRLYDFTVGTARCSVGPLLAEKYGMEPDNMQLVVSVTNRITFEQTWFNEARTRKPQTFKAEAGGAVDPTDGGRRCDFCRWQELTAEDSWGRHEGPHAVSASNLFKYGQPAHGLILFKHHDPLAFSLQQLADFLAVSDRWLAAAAATHPAARHPFFLWNCGPRAGASQFHGHGQTMLTKAPVPTQALLDQQAALHARSHPGTSLYRDLLEAHAAVGLARVVCVGEDRCWLLAHMSPIKDCEVLLLCNDASSSGGTSSYGATSSGTGSSASSTGSSSSSSGAASSGSTSRGGGGGGLSSPALAAGLHAALRALLDGLGVQAFNCGLLNLGQGAGAAGRAAAEGEETEAVAASGGGVAGRAAAEGKGAEEVLAGGGGGGSGGG
ncbi:hypothetical protein TSOC_008285, partial [Tetrabaena socialis]